MAPRAKPGDESVAAKVDSAPEDAVKRRAFEIYLERGSEPGRDLEDWFQAERELTVDE